MKVVDQLLLRIPCPSPIFLLISFPHLINSSFICLQVVVPANDIKIPLVLVIRGHFLANCGPEKERIGLGPVNEFLMSNKARSTTVKY